MHKIGADPIIAVSYMPQVLDAVPNNERQSAPKDYAAGKDLCFQAANTASIAASAFHFGKCGIEVNTGWLKPGPQDTGADEFRTLYAKALGKEDTNTTTVRRFESLLQIVSSDRAGNPSGRFTGQDWRAGTGQRADGKIRVRPLLARQGVRPRIDALVRAGNVATRFCKLARNISRSRK